MIVLDGCCGAGGVSRGFVDAGHVVWGIDVAPQPNYLKSGAAGFLQADILEALRQPWIRDVDFIHVSPPCQHYSAMSRCRPDLAEQYPELITPVRELLNATGRPWVIENVPAARPWMKDPVLLCAQMFRPGTLLYRHRLLEAGGGMVLYDPPTPRVSSRYRIGECGRLAYAVRALTGWEVVVADDPYYGGSSHLLVRLPDGRLLDAEGLHDPAEFPGAEGPLTPGCDCEACAGWDEPDVRQEAATLMAAISTTPRNRACGWPHPVPASRAGHWKPGTAISVAGHVGNVALAREVMEISWTTREELAEAVPPYYSEWVGRQIGPAR